MNEELDHIHKPNSKSIARTNPDITAVLFRCYSEDMPPEQVITVCQSSGIKNLTTEDVETLYQDFADLAAWLNKTIVPYLKTN